MQVKKKHRVPTSLPCGFMKDIKTGNYYIFMPAEALDDFDLMVDCLDYLEGIDPSEYVHEEDTKVH